MEKDFRYLIWKYGDSGARTRFESICQRLLDRMYGSAYSVQPYPGDDGIDVYVNSNNEITVYQCKFFYGRIEASQKQHIVKSLASLMSSAHWENTNKWGLCIPTVLNSKEHAWWLNWSQGLKATHGKEFVLLQEDNLINLLRQHGLYREVFEVVEVDLIDVSRNSRKYIDLLIPIVNEVETNDFHISSVDFMIECDCFLMECRNAPFFKNSSLVGDIDELSAHIAYNAFDGMIEREDVLKRISVLRGEILNEYARLFY